MRLDRQKPLDLSIDTQSVKSSTTKHPAVCTDAKCKQCGLPKFNSSVKKAKTSPKKPATPQFSSTGTHIKKGNEFGHLCEFDVAYTIEKDLEEETTMAKSS